MAPGLIRRRAPLSIRPWRGRDGNLRSPRTFAPTTVARRRRFHPPTRSGERGGAPTLRSPSRGKGLRPARGFVKGGALALEGHRVTPTVDAPTLADPVANRRAAPASARSIISSPPGSSGSNRRSCSRRRSSSTCRARRFAAACSSPPTPRARSCACGRNIRSPSAAPISLRTGPADRANTPISARCSGRAPARTAKQTQTGLESFGRRDAEAADAEVFALAMEAAEAAGAARSPRGSATPRCSTACCMRSIFPTSGGAVCAAASRKGAASTRSSTARARARGASRRAGGAGKRRSRRGQGAGRGSALAIAGIERGRRTQRRRDRRSLPRSGVAALGRADAAAEKRAVLEAFLAISGDPDEAALALRRLAGCREARSRRPRSTPSSCATASSRRAGRNRGDFAFGAAFVRDLDYYTGFVFEAIDAARRRARPRSAAAATTVSRDASAPDADIPAVGAAIWLDRLANGGER